MTHQTADYWVGSLAMTIAWATVEPDPKPVLESALAQFLKGRPAGDELGDMLRAMIEPRKGNT